jgi:hypothetical protein
MSIINNIKLHFLFKEIHKILKSWKGELLCKYDIGGIPIPEDLKKGVEKPVLNLINGRDYIIFFYKKPVWSIYVGIMVSKYLDTYWVESKWDEFSLSSLSEDPPIPKDIQEEISELILKNKEYYIETVKSWVEEAKTKYAAKYGR